MLEGIILLNSVDKKCCSLEGAGSLLTGIGTVIVGLAAIIALYKTDKILEQLTKVQETANEIRSAVSLLESEIKALKAASLVTGSKLLQSPSPSKEELEKVFGIELMPKVKGSGVYLPQDKRELLIEQLLKTKDIRQRENLIQNSLEVSH